MHNPGAGGLERIRQASWLQTASIALREKLTVSNLVGLIGVACALFLLLVLREPWNYRIPFYGVMLIWTILRPRTALYLMPFAVPWGSLDTIDVAGLHVNSADILVALLGAGWLMSFGLLPTFTRDGKGLSKRTIGMLGLLIGCLRKSLSMCYVLF